MPADLDLSREILDSPVHFFKLFFLLPQFFSFFYTFLRKTGVFYFSLLILGHLFSFYLYSKKTHKFAKKSIIGYT